ncbi:DUF7144 family membrane protein [Catenulispora subtropica]|uniref:DUF7144 domain-containing protein n=1 Tax=Catenulispora subtropica TaxID=450798 RepID=A0ABP5D6T9_9ACTN
MAQYTADPGARRGSPWAYGLTLFAGIMMVISGVMDLFYGIAAAAKDDIIVSTPNYWFKLNTTGWGWIHIILGLLLILVGASVLMGQTWARYAGIVVVGLAAIGNFVSLPYYPWWSAILLAIDVFVIWGLATARPVESV